MSPATPGTTNKSAGFTLVEMLLSVAILAVITAISAPVFNGMVVRNDLDVASEQIAYAMRRAQTYARGMDDDSAWGINVASGTVTLYKGAVYASRDANFDETISIPSAIAVSGLTGVQFTKFTGAPSTTGAVTLTSNANETRSITINAKGMVDY
jgi:prepilin-type N-terminal cleavage/methylation domain-containing protein